MYRRTSKWQPPTLLDSILLSPLNLVIHTVYHILLLLHGPPIKPSTIKSQIRTICLSDTHSNVVLVPPGDLLIHAGDLTNSGTVEDIQKQIDWLDSLPGFTHKIIIAGNHDSYFDEKSRQKVDRLSGKSLDYKGLIYLQDESISLTFMGGRTLNVYGAGDLPRCGGDDNAFQYDRYATPWKNRIPNSTDILVTHTPPRHHLDIDLGCDGLLEEIWRVKPRYHICGHVHSGHGRRAMFWDDTQKAYEAFLNRDNIGLLNDVIPSMAWINASKIIISGFKDVISSARSRRPDGSLLINAALIYQSTGKIGNPVEVVDV